MANTTKRHRSFTPASVDQKPITFDILDEEFEARPALPGAVILDFIASSGGGDEGGGEVAKKLLGFFERALTPESHERFAVLINDPDKAVDLETLSEIVGWLIEEYTSRPTRAS